MKNLLLSLGILVVIIIAMSFKTKKSDLPPGTIEVKANFYFDKTEIRNLDWEEFLYWTKRIYGVNSKEYLAIIPDTTVWESEELTSMQKNYLRNPQFNEYPVVGITLEQANLFCKWRTDRVNEMLWVKSGKEWGVVKELKYEYKDLPKVVEYRIPTKDEWLLVSNNLNLKEDEKKKDKRKINTKYLTYQTASFKIQKISGLDDNVSEMTSENGVAMGGNWKNGNNYNEVKYTESSNIIGFRCVCKRIVK